MTLDTAMYVIGIACILMGAGISMGALTDAALQHRRIVAALKRRPQFSPAASVTRPRVTPIPQLRASEAGAEQTPVRVR